MRDYGKVHTTFWSSRTIRSLSEDGRTLALYLLTSPHSSIAGVFRLPDGYVCEDLNEQLGWGSERVAKGFAELFRNRFANRCETTKWVWVIDHFEWNPLENPNQRKAARKIAESVPDDCAWKPEFIGKCGHLLGMTDAEIENCLETLRERLPNQDQEQEQNQEQNQEYIHARKSEKDHNRRASKGPADHEKGRYPPDHDHHAEFERRVRAKYPHTTHVVNWIVTEQHCLTLITVHGLTWDDIEAIVDRYLRYVSEGGVSGPQYVKTPQNLFAPNGDLWKQPWDPPPKPPTKAEKRLDSNIDAFEQAKRELMRERKQ